MARLDKERQKELEPQRIRYAKEQLKKKGVEVCEEFETELRFVYKGNLIAFFPYSGWHTGKGITDGRGLCRLLVQLENEKD